MSKYHLGERQTFIYYSPTVAAFRLSTARHKGGTELGAATSYLIYDERYLVLLHQTQAQRV